MESKVVFGRLKGIIDDSVAGQLTLEFNKLYIA